jgi:hypothetical protein
MGKLIKFNKQKTTQKEANCERRLQELYWENAVKDIDALLRLYLFEHYKGEVFPDFYARQLRSLRETQGFVPSLADISLKAAFDDAMAGGVKVVGDIFGQERKNWHDQAVHYGGADYLGGVINAVVSNDVEILDVMIDRLMKDPKSLKAAAKKIGRAKSPEPIARELTSGLMKIERITGRRLRERIESMSGVALANECRNGRVVAQTYGSLLTFTPK